MNSINFIHKKYRKKYIIWLQKSNRYIVLKESAFDTFKYLNSKTKNAVIYDHLVKKHLFTREESKQLVQEIKLGITQLNEPESTKSELSNLTEYKNYSFSLACKQDYSINNKTVSISFENYKYRDFLHPLLHHLYPDQSKHPDFHFEIFSANQRIFIREGKNILSEFPEKESYLLTNKIISLFLNKAHNKLENDWLIYAHASAISNEKETILFVGKSGSGKSTLAALLINKGYKLVSDDLVLVDKNKVAFSFPSAISVKQGALKTLIPYFPELLNKKEIDVPPDKKVRYLSQKISSSDFKNNYPIHKVIFVQFNPAAKLKLTKISRFKGISAFLDQAYIEPDTERAKTFLDWALQVSYYKLNYSDNQKAINEMTKLFESEH